MGSKVKALKTLNKFEKTHGFQRHKVVDARICPYFCLRPYQISYPVTSSMVCYHDDWFLIQSIMPKYRYCIDCQMWEFWMDEPEDRWY